MRLTSLLVLSAKYCDIDFYFSLHSSLYAFLGIATALVQNHFNLPFEGSKASKFDPLMLWLEQAQLDETLMLELHQSGSLVCI